MGRYSKAVRAASIKRIAVVRTVGDDYVCVECGESPIESRSHDGPAASAAAAPDRPVATDD